MIRLKRIELRNSCHFLHLIVRSKATSTPPTADQSFRQRRIIRHSMKFHTSLLVILRVPKAIVFVDPSVFIGDSHLYAAVNNGIVVIQRQIQTALFLDVK